MSHLSCVTPHPYPVNPMNQVTTKHPLIYDTQDIFCPTNETNKIRAFCEIRVQKYYSNNRKRFRDASRYTSKKISLKLLFLSDIFLFPFVRQQFPILAYRCSWRQCCCFVDNIGYIFKEVNTLQSAGACKRIEHSCPFGTSMRPEEKRVSSG